MNVADLQEFYASPLGKATQRLIAAKLKLNLLGQSTETIVGLGYSVPFIEEILLANSHATVLAFMMARRGVMAWPDSGAILSTLVDEHELPLATNSVGTALLAHSLEFTDSPEDLLEEIWRILSPQGKLLLVVPNRRSLWAATDNSPFGHGQPFSRSQLVSLLKAAQFSVSRVQNALFMPPSAKLADWPIANGIEKIGAWTFPSFAGVIIIEATKQIYAYVAEKRVNRRLLRLRPALLPAPHGVRGQI